ncbi:hypothetical protein QG37_01854 [Candidozyma auris]|uniref:Uncharacterized protein n=1 Tax=Candidozyma auris TaxID=498019 RepID=A0A0L0P3N7_CANAR|nr:hypothetical protein QG37_01854 [[Candida] auris]
MTQGDRQGMIATEKWTQNGYKEEITNLVTEIG